MLTGTEREREREREKERERERKKERVRARGGEMGKDIHDRQTQTPDGGHCSAFLTLAERLQEKRQTCNLLSSGT